MISTAGGNISATYFNNTFTQFNMSNFGNESSYIWQGPGTDTNCPRSIRAVQDFQVKCVDHKVKFDINADARYNFTLSSPSYTKTGSGISNTSMDHYEYDPPAGNFSCGQIFHLVADASNSGSMSCVGNQARLAFSFYQGDCYCDVAGSYYSWQTCGCAVCSVVIQGCLTCNAPDPTTVVCTSCATTNGWVLSGTTCVCGLPSPMIGCVYCISSTSTCTLCNALGNFVLVAGKCVCSPGYTLVNGTCLTCTSVISNCVACSSPTTCTACVSATYTLSGGLCPTCASLLPNCVTCTSPTTCVACVNASYVLISGHCVACSTPMVGCSTCSSVSMCTTCNTAGFFTKTGSNCVCITGYTLTGTTCSTCASQMVGCSVCSSATVCTNCNATGNFAAGGANGCVCKAGYALSGTSCVTCGSVLPGCTTCSSTTTCTGCDSTLHLMESGGICVCATNYTLNGGVCTLCSSLLLNCVDCTSASSCTSCLSGYGVDAATGQCMSCTIVYDPHCTNCSNTACTACDSTGNWVLTGTTCTCLTPTTVLSGGVCVLCSTQTGCQQCTTLTTCTVCASGYFLNTSSNCQPCSTGCVTCSSLSACTQCDPHYALVTLGINSFCTLCSSFITGCDTCSSSTTCTACQTTGNLLLNASTGVCDCATGYYNDTTACVTCSGAMYGCLQCTSASFCTSCDPTLNLVASGTGTCDCATGYTLNASGNCTLCSYFMPNCNTCTDTTTCTACDSTYGVNSTSGACQSCGSMLTGCLSCTNDLACAVCSPTYALDGSNQCQLCITFMTNCADCSNNSTCTLCSAPNYMLDPTDLSCKPCYFFMVGCLTCDSTTNCLSCDTTNHFDFSATACDCVSPYVLKTSTGTCETCPTVQPTCQLCATESTCLVCLSGSYVNGTSQCQTCPTGCLTCNSATNCYTCNLATSYKLVGTMCVCDIGYTADPTSGICTAVCGDGLVAGTEGCDDGNLISGDGCDSFCLTETNFTCFAFPGLPSTCSYNKPLSLNLTSVVKTPGSNSVSFNFDIGPMLPNLNSINISSLIQTSVPLQNPRFVLTPEGKLTLTFDYNQTLDGQPISVIFTPAGGSENLFAVPPTNISFSLSDVNNTPIAYYNETVYQKQQSFDKAYKGGVGIAYGVTAIGMACDKVIGVELFGVWQVAHLSLSNIDRVQPLLEPLMSLGLVNGINSQLDFNTTQVPRRVSAINYEAEFLSNVNYMLWLVLADVIIGASLYFVASLVPTYKEKMQEIGLRMLKEYLLMLVLFNTFNFAYSAGLQFTYAKTLVSVNSLVAVSAMLLPLVAAVAVTFTDPKQFGEFKNHYRSDGMSQTYFVWTIAYRIVLGVCMSQLNEVEEATIVTFSLSVLFMVYLLTNTPYIRGYQNYRAVADQASIMVSLFVAMYYRSMKSTADVETVSQLLAPAYASIVSMYTATGISVGSLAYELYLKFKPESKPDTKFPSNTSSAFEEHPTQNNLDSNVVMESVLNQYP